MSDIQPKPKPLVVPIVLAALVVAGGAFYGGTKFAQAKAPRGAMMGQVGAQRGQFMAREGGMGAGAGFAVRANGGFVTGEITAKDDASVTVKGMDGNSKIVFFGASTKLSKSVEAAAADLAVGQHVVVSGEAGADGTLTAQSIDLRAAGDAGRMPMVR